MSKSADQTINVTINITIQRLAVKDPNRWIADMGDMLKQHQRVRGK